MAKSGKSGDSGKDAKSTNAASAAARASQASAGNQPGSGGALRGNANAGAASRGSAAGGSNGQPNSNSASRGTAGGGSATRGLAGGGAASRGTAGTANGSGTSSGWMGGGTSRTGSVGRGLAGAAGLGSTGSGGNVSSTRQSDAKSTNAAKAAARQASTARTGTTVAGRPDTPVGSLPASRGLASTVVGRPDVPVGSLPAARAPSYRQAEIKSLGDMARQGLAPNTTAAAKAPSYRQAEEQTMAKENAWQDALATIRAPEAGTTNPYNRVVQGTGTPSYADLENMTIGEVRAFQRQMKASGAYPSDAVGAYQMISGTLGEAVRRTGLPETTKFTKATQDYLARDLMQNRANQVDAKDGSVNPTSLANQFSKEWASFQNQQGVGHYDKNGIDKGSVPASTVKGMAEGLTSTGAIGTQAPTQTRNLGRQVSDRKRSQSFAETPETVSVPPTRTFADKYLGMGRPAGPVPSNVGPGSYRAKPASRELMSDQEQAAVYGEQPGGLPVGATPTPSVSDTQPAPRSIDPSQPVSPVAPSPVSPVGATPVAPVKSPSLAPSEETTVKAPLTTGQKIAAGAIDVGVGMIPGVGVAATVYNGLATLAGVPTIGGMAVNLLGDGSRLGSSGVGTDRETGSRREYRDPKTEDAKEPAPVPEIQRFRDVYLIPKVRRPTPAEKWGRNRRRQAAQV